MKILGVIPARWASTRFEGKVLASIAGKPMIQHVWENARKSERLDDLLIACDDEKVLLIAQQFGAEAVLTSTDHASGTERIMEVAGRHEADVIVNIQGDEPMIRHTVIDRLAQCLVDDKDAQMATVIKKCRDEKELDNPNIVKVVVDRNKDAMYFSRSRIPYNRNETDFAAYKHIGIYAYRRDFLLKYGELPESGLEKSEGLEQLRALEAGYKIKTVETDVETIGVDTPEDLEAVEKELK